MDRPKGRLPEGMKFRSPTHDPYSVRVNYIEPDRSRYEGIHAMNAGDRSTLPDVALDTRFPPESLKAIRDALTFHEELERLDDEGSVGIASHHFLNSLIDYVESEGFAFDKVLDDVLTDRLAGTGREPPRISNMTFRVEAAPKSVGSITSGKATLERYVELARIEDEGSAYIGAYHALNSLIDIHEFEGIDFARTVEDVQIHRLEELGVAPSAPSLAR
jgi:hypothetical protein